MKRDFLLEIGVEELPTSFVRIGTEGLYNSFKTFLERENIDYGKILTYSTPRRLTLIIEGLSEIQNPKEEKIKGPPYRVAFDSEGKPLPSAYGFAKKQGVEVEDLIIEEEGNRRYVYAIKREEGKKTEDLLKIYIPEIIEKLYFPKTMLWGEGTFRFARPIHWLVVLYGDRIIDIEIAGIKASSYTFGHRFISPSKIEIPHPSKYKELLRDAYVIVDRDERKSIIERGYKEISENLGGDDKIPSLELLEEVTDLIEYPTVMVGQFSEKYLKLPYEIPVSVMEDHQRYFPVYKNGKLLPYFVFVSNSLRKNEEIIVHGNERVIRARLEDAMFYFTKDNELTLEDRIDALKRMVFHKELGTLYDKVERIRDVSKALLEYIKKEELIDIVDRVAYLSKADLATYLVREFPELEGIIGREFAILNGEPKEVAEGIYEHYLPKRAGDPLPKTWGGKIVSIVDKLDTIFSYFSVDLVPSGSFDPYGLRRKAQGVISILLWDKELDISLWELLRIVYRVMSSSGFVKIEHLMMVREFFVDRVKNILATEGIRYDIINSVIVDNEIGSLKALLKKAKTFSNLYNTTDFKESVVAFNRLNNILKKFNAKGKPSKDLFSTDFELRLFNIWQKQRDAFNKTLMNRDYDAAIKILSEFKPYIDEFFDNVLVMDKDERVKENRLKLLNFILEDLKKLGDFSKIEGLV